MSKTHKEILEMILEDIPKEICRSWNMRNNCDDYLVKEIFIAIERLLSEEQAKTTAAKEDARAARRERDEHKAAFEKLATDHDSQSQYVCSGDHKIATLKVEIEAMKQKIAADAEEIMVLKMTERLWYGQSRTIRKDMQDAGWENFQSHPVDAVVILLQRIRSQQDKIAETSAAHATVCAELDKASSWVFQRQEFEKKLEKMTALRDKAARDRDINERRVRKYVEAYNDKLVKLAAAEAELAELKIWRGTIEKCINSTDIAYKHLEALLSDTRERLAASEKEVETLRINNKALRDMTIQDNERNQLRE